MSSNLSPSPLPSPPPRVLVVDDEPINVQMLAEVLTETCDVRFTTDGRRCGELARELAVDLILLDLQMPELDGFAVLAELKADPATRDIPVIIVTAMDAIDDEEAGLSAGAVDYITKPISPPIVRARVRTHIELKRQRDTLRDLAALDGLTGIANRRRFDERLEQRWRQALRNGSGLCLMLADVDHFKQYNDHYGHGPGDDCLRQVARVLLSCSSRPEDLVARYGGEEFALIVDLDDGPPVAENVLGTVAMLAIPHARSSVGPIVSLSIGVIAGHPQPEQSPESLLAAADQLLYQAKHEGRGRAVYRRLDSPHVSTIVAGALR